MKEPVWTVYCHIHITSGRLYVGLTKKTMLQRWNQHVYMSGLVIKKGWSHFANAIRKYGRDAFEHEVLGVYDTLEAANAAEERWIDQLGTRDPSKGFNLMRGGFHVPHPIRKNPWDRPEYREKYLPRIIVIGQLLETRAKQRASMTTPESKRKRSQSSREVQSRPEVKEKLRKANVGKGPNKQAHENSRVASKRPDIIEIISSKLRGRPISEEHKEKTIKIWIGRTHSPEARANISASLRAGKPGSLSAEDRIAFRRENARLGRIRRKTNKT
jgi:hypothetical protein